MSTSAHETNEKRQIFSLAKGRDLVYGDWVEQHSQ